MHIKFTETSSPESIDSFLFKIGYEKRNTHYLNILSDEYSLHSKCTAKTKNTNTTRSIESDVVRDPF